MWLISMGFTIRENIWLLAIGTLGYLALIPVAEAAEQTVLQKVVPFEKQGRVFGLAQSVEVASAPVSAFIIGPVAEFWLIPFTNSDAGRAQWGWLLGDGQARGIALVFLLAGLAGLALTLFAFTTRSYRWLSARYAEPSDTPAAEPDDASTTAG
jgi:DHA3 family multidrug efflux protein-like MFS transporter